MSRQWIIMTLALTLATTGCGRKKPDPVPEPKPVVPAEAKPAPRVAAEPSRPAPPEPEAAAPVVEAAEPEATVADEEEAVVVDDPEAVVLVVNGTPLVRREVEAATDSRVKLWKGTLDTGLAPDRYAKLRANFAKQVAADFIVKQLVNAEAMRLGITLTEAEVRAVLEDEPRPALQERAMAERLLGKVFDTVNSKPIGADEEELAEARDQVSTLMNLPARIRARHILISVDPDADEAEWAAQRSKADRVRQQLLDGGDFTALAERNSDATSVRWGGDLGVFPRGRMPLQFDEAAFSQQPGEIGEVVATDDGFHIIQVTDYLAPGVVDEEQVEAMVVGRKRKQALQAFLADLEAKAEISRGP